MPVLDYVPRFDERSKLPQFRAVRQIAETTRTYRHWTLSIGVLDQKARGACVGHGMTAGISGPPNHVRTPTPQATAFGIYDLCLLIDDVPGEADEGTSVLTGCQATVKMGLCTGYHWCFGVEDVARTILDKGVVVVGTEWRTNMFQPSADGLIDIRGGVEGGHCYAVNGFTRSATLIPAYRGPLFQIRNSWGADWGKKGSAFIRYDDLGALLAAGGEAAILIP